MRRRIRNASHCCPAENGPSARILGEGSASARQLGVLSWELIRRTYLMVWEAGPGQAALMVALMLVESLMPAATVWLGKEIVDALASAPRGAPGAVESGLP